MASFGFCPLGMWESKVRFHFLCCTGGVGGYFPRCFSTLKTVSLFHLISWLTIRQDVEGVQVGKDG